MGLISKSMGIVLCFGFGYYMGNNNSEPLQTKDKIAEVQQLHHDKVPDTNVLGPDNIAINYVMSAQFEGYLFTNIKTGEQGVLVDTPSFGPSHGTNYLRLEEKVESPLAKIAVMGDAKGPDSWKRKIRKEILNPEYWVERIDKGIEEVF